MKDVEVVISNETTALSQKGFGLPFIFDPKQAFGYTEVESTADVPVGSDTMVYKMVARMLEQSPKPSKIAIAGVDIATDGVTIAEALDTISTEYNDWYFELIASREAADIQAAASWGGANGKLFIGQNKISDSADSVVTLGGNIASSRAGIFSHNGGSANADPFLDAAIVGRIAPLQPGAVTWKFKKCNGVPVATYLNADISKLHAGNINTYVSKLGMLQTSEGKATDGTYLDIQRSTDWLTARIQENICFLLYNSNKISYMDAGIAQIVTTLKTTLKSAVGSGVIAKDENGIGLWTVSAPRRVDIPVNTRANRILPDVNFTAIVAGAIHNVQVNGVLKV